MDESGKWGRSDYQFTFRKIHRGNADVLSLTVIDFNEEDDGIYVCKATNEAGEALSNKAILKYIECSQRSSSNIKLFCFRNTTTDYFMDESGKWGRSDYQFTFRKIHRGNADVLSLTVIDFNEEDDGIYVCKATNEAGEALSNKAILKYIGKLYEFNERYYNTTQH
ncbi:unnamed protein product [Mytilus edulis]|uniref:Ig-like domain-containing protein n=1 Tax=Mytilus edulis TaxID=6550 RepID=A0A8S3QMR3_MYTED|nr:unnamed protein product [Mytilus edulis]